MTYGIHALEPMQAMVERRRGGETGVSAVTCLEGEAVWESARRGDWSRELLQAAWDAISEKPAGDVEELSPEPAVFLIEYRDGLRSAVLILPRGTVSDWAYAARAAGGEMTATEFNHFKAIDPMQNANAHFSYLGLNIEEMFLTGAPAYPVERTLLTSGILAAAMDSRHAGHAAGGDRLAGHRVRVVQRAGLAADRSAPHRGFDRSLAAVGAAYGKQS